MKFEKLIVHSIEDWEDKVSDRLGELYREEPEAFVGKIWHDWNETVPVDYFDEDDSPEDIRFKAEEDITGYYNGFAFEIHNLSLELVEMTNVYCDAEDWDEYNSSIEFNEFLVNVSEMVSIDPNVDGVLDNTRLKVNLFPLQTENANTEGTEMYEVLDAIIARYIDRDYNPGYRVDKSKADKSKIINLLFESQGYTLEDLGKPALIVKSKFLTSFIEEVVDGTEDGIESLYFTVLLGMTGREYLDYLRNDEYTIVMGPGKWTTLGLYSPSTGSGSELGIKLEKPFTFPVKDCLIQIEGRKWNPGYTVNDTYGFVDDVWSDNYKFGLKGEK